MALRPKRLRGENGKSRRSLYMPDNLYEVFAKISCENELSVNAQMVIALEEWAVMHKVRK